MALPQEQDAGWAHLSRLVPLVDTDTKDVEPSSHRADGARLEPIRVSEGSEGVNGWKVIYPEFSRDIQTLVEHWWRIACKRKQLQGERPDVYKRIWKNTIVHFIKGHEFRQRCRAYAFLCKLIQDAMVGAPSTKCVTASQTIRVLIQALMQTSLDHFHSASTLALLDSGWFDINEHVTHCWTTMPFLHAVIVKGMSPDVLATVLPFIGHEALNHPIHRWHSAEEKAPTWTPLLLTLNQMYTRKLPQNWHSVEAARALLEELLKYAWTVQNPWAELELTVGAAVLILGLDEHAFGPDSPWYTPLHFMYMIGSVHGFSVSIKDDTPSFQEDPAGPRWKLGLPTVRQAQDPQHEVYWSRLKQTCHAFMRIYKEQKTYKTLRFSMAQRDIDSSTHLLPPLVEIVLSFLATK